MKLKELVEGEFLEYVLTDDKAIRDKAWSDFQSELASNSGVMTEQKSEELLHHYGGFMYYDLLMDSLKKNDKNYYKKLTQEIKQKKEDTEIDIDYLEKLFPMMRQINFVGGIYNKQYGSEEREVFEFRAGVKTGSRKNEIVERIVMAPYNVRRAGEPKN